MIGRKTTSRDTYSKSKGGKRDRTLIINSPFRFKSTTTARKTSRRRAVVVGLWTRAEEPRKGLAVVKLLGGL